MKSKGVLAKFIIPLCILAVAFLVMRFIILNRTAPQKQPTRKPGVLVETSTAARQDRPAQVLGTGTVQASQEVTVTMQVSGKVVEAAPQFVAGGFFKKDDFLFAVEDTDYRLAVERARASLVKAQSDAAMAESQAMIARQEWERLHNGDMKPNPLVLYEPQLATAMANVSAAAAALSQAELDLSRTRVTAPFDCRVRSENIAMGQYVRAGGNVAELAATDAAEIIVPLPQDDLQWLTVPRPGSVVVGSAVTVIKELGGRQYEWSGQVDRSLGEIDALTRMARLAVRVNDPYGSANGTLSLDAGMFVETALHGIMLKDVFILPRKALRDNSTVWIMDGEDKLQVRQVKQVRVERDEVFISDGLAEGDRVVLTGIPGAANGMALRQLSAEGEGK